MFIITSVVLVFTPISLVDFAYFFVWLFEFKSLSVSMIMGYKSMLTNTFTYFNRIDLSLDKRVMVNMEKETHIFIPLLYLHWDLTKI